MRSLAELEASRALRAFLALEWHELERLLRAPIPTRTATGDEMTEGERAAADGGTAATDGAAAEGEGAATTAGEGAAATAGEEAAATAGEGAAAAEGEEAAADDLSLPLRLLQTLLHHVMGCPLLRSVVRDAPPSPYNPHASPQPLAPGSSPHS